MNGGQRVILRPQSFGSITETNRQGGLVKFLILVMGLLFCAGQAQAAAAAPAAPPAAPNTIERIEVFEFGLYERGPVIQELPPTPAGIGRAISDGFKHLRTTRKVPAQLGTSFGFRYRTEGRFGYAPLTQILILPPPGIDSPLSGRTVLRDAMPGHVVVGNEDMMMMTFDHKWEMVEGIWTIELWSGDRKLGSESFEIFIPPTS